MWCMKTEVYSWRVSTEIKNGMEREARRRDNSLSAALDLAAKDWLAKTNDANDRRKSRCVSIGPQRNVWGSYRAAMRAGRRRRGKE